MIVGLAIDCIVHIAEGYQQAAGSTRLERVENVLTEIGMSVFSGAVTTLGASFFMLFAQILFFHQHGLFMFASTALALVYALGAFVILLAWFGPETKAYSVTGLVKRIGKTAFASFLCGNYFSTSNCNCHSMEEDQLQLLKANGEKV